MKKIIAICLFLLLVMTCTTTAFATEDSCAGSGETEIIAHIYSSYTISIPATIDMTAGMRGEVTISDSNLESGYKVDVFATNFNEDGGITLHHESISGTTATCMLTNIELNTCASPNVPLVSFYDTELVGYGSSLTKYFDVQLMPIGMAGQYTGTMTYSFECTQY